MREIPEKREPPKKVILSLLPDTFSSFHGLRCESILFKLKSFIEDNPITSLSVFRSLSLKPHYQT